MRDYDDATGAVRREVAAQTPRPSHTRPGSSDGGGSVPRGGENRLTAAPEHEIPQLGPSLSGGSAGVRHESRQAAGADLTGPLMVRPQGTAAGVDAHSATGRTPEPSLRDFWVCAACLVALVVIVFAALFIRT